MHDVAGADFQALLLEAAIIAQFHRDRVMRSIGVVTIGSPLMVVMEYYEHGALNNYLAQHTFSLKI